MAKKINSQDFFDASVQKSIEKLIERLKELDGQYEKLANDIQKNKATLQGYTETNTKLRDTAEKVNATMKEAAKISKAQVEAQAKLNIAGSEEAKKLEETKQKIRAKNQEVKQSIALGGRDARTITAQNATLRELEAALRMNRMAYTNMSAEERKNAQIGGRLNTIIQKQAKEVDMLRTSMGQAQQRVGGYSEALGKMRQSITMARAKIMALVAAFATIIRFGKSSIENYDEQIKSQKSLEVALGKTSKALISQASALQQKTTYGDEAIMQGQAFLAQMGLQEDAILKLTPAILDMATAQGMDLESAFKLVAKSVGSSTNALSRYGIEIEGTAGSSERTQSAIDALTKAFGGQAEAAAKVGLGPLQQLKNAYGDLKETVGKFILDGLNPMISAFKKELEYRNELISIRSRKKDLESEMTQVALLVSKLQDANIKRDDELKIIGELQKISPERFKNLQNEKDAAKMAKEELALYNDEKIKEIMLLSLDEQAVKNRNKLLKETSKLTRIAKEEFNYLSEAQRSLLKLIQNGDLNAAEKKQLEQMSATITEYASNFGATLSEGPDAMKEFSNQASQYLQIVSSKLYEMADNKDISRYFDNNTEAAQLFADEFNKISAIAKNATGAYVSFFEYNPKKFEKTKEKITELTAAVEDDNAAMQSLRDELNALIAVKEDDNKLTEEELAAAEDRKKKADAFLATLQDINQEYQLSLQLARNQSETYDATIKYWEELYNAYKQYYKDGGYTQQEIDRLKELQQEIDKLKMPEAPLNEPEKMQTLVIKPIVDEDSTTKIKESIETALNDIELRITVPLEEPSTSKEKLLKFWDKYGQTGMDAINSIADVERAFYDRKMEQHQAELNSIQQEYESRIEAAEGNSELQNQLRQEQKIAEDAINKKILAEKQKQAKIDKQLAAFEAAINGAVAIIKASGNPILMALTAATVAAQIAAIEARPIPQFQKGTKNHPGGESIVGELGSELYITPSKVVGLTPDVASLMQFQKGTQIFTHEDTIRFLSIAAQEKKQEMQLNEKDYSIYLKKIIKNTGKSLNINILNTNNEYKKRYIN